MTEKPPTPSKPESVLGALPSSRPHRRSDKRRAPATESPAAKAKAPAQKATAAKKPATAKKAATAKKPAAAKKTATARAEPAATSRTSLRQPPQPRGLPPRGETPQRPKTQRPARPAPGGRDLLATAVQAAAELTEMGLSAGARALRDAVSRLPRP